MVGGNIVVVQGDDENTEGGLMLIWIRNRSRIIGLGELDVGEHAKLNTYLNSNVNRRKISVKSRR